MAELRQTCQQVKADIINTTRTLALALALPRFFRDRVTLDRAQEETKRLLDTRVERFLELCRVQIYERAGSPYRALLRHAGCAFADLETNVKRHGLEETLALLAGEGVYLTSDEFKGKTRVIRGHTSFRVVPKDFEQRNSMVGFTIESSGTRNAPVSTFSPLKYRGVQAMGNAIFYAAHDLFSCAHAVYEPVIAGRMNHVIINGKLGIATDRWFALKVPAHSRAEDKYHYLNAQLVATLGRRFGPGIADPEFLDPGDVQPILTWASELGRQRRHCCITTVVSNAARISREASRVGLSLETTTFSCSGEPLTEAKRQLIEKAGARIALHYGPGGGNGTSLGCTNPQSIDEMHVPWSVFTLVENPRSLDYEGSPIYPLMITTLDASAPRLLFNVENGDYATLLKRDCGCPLQRVGFSQHLHTVRSFEKFTSEGMNYSARELFDLLENTIPSEFGGGPGDYQLVEEEDDNGQSRLTLVVHPGLGTLNEERLISRLQWSLAQGSRNHRFMSKLWQDAGAFRVRREAPYASRRGKILPLHISQARNKLSDDERTRTEIGSDAPGF
jgi:hypothetical protein